MRTPAPTNEQGNSNEPGGQSELLDRAVRRGTAPLVPVGAVLCSDLPGCVLCSSRLALLIRITISTPHASVTGAHTATRQLRGESPDDATPLVCWSESVPDAVPNRLVLRLPLGRPCIERVYESALAHHRHDSRQQDRQRPGFVRASNGDLSDNHSLSRESVESNSPVAGERATERTANDTSSVAQSGTDCPSVTDQLPRLPADNPRFDQSKREPTEQECEVTWERTARCGGSTERCAQRVVV